MKKHAPAALRNRDPIAAVLDQELPESGTVLEIASGSGEHIVHFAHLFGNLDWQPSDPDPEAIASILAYFNEYDGTNLRLPRCSMRHHPQAGRFATLMQSCAST